MRAIPQLLHSRTSSHGNSMHVLSPPRGRGGVLRRGLVRRMQIVERLERPHRQVRRYAAPPTAHFAPDVDVIALEENLQLRTHAACFPLLARRSPRRASHSESPGGTSTHPRRPDPVPTSAARYGYSPLSPQITLPRAFLPRPQPLLTRSLTGSGASRRPPAAARAPSTRLAPARSPRTSSRPGVMS